MTTIKVPVQGFKFTQSLTAVDSDGSLALVVSPGKSRGGGIELSGTFVGTLQFEQYIGASWIAKTVYPAAGGAGVTSATATGTWKFKAGGETYVRVRCSAFTSGAIVTDVALTAGEDAVTLPGGTTGLPAVVTGSGAAGTPAAGFQSVQGASYKSSNTLTRTADTTAYTANDVLGINNAGSAGAAALTFASMGPTGGGDIIITDCELEIDKTAVPSGMTSFRLYLYSVTPPSALLDNVAWDLPAGDRAAYMGYIDLGTPVDLGSTLYVQTSGVNLKRTLASSSLFAYLVTNGGYTPASGDVQKITLHAVGM